MQYGAVFVWWVLYVVLGILGLPIAGVLFSRLRDRGAAFALPVSFVVLFVSVYWIGRVTFGPLAVALAVVLLGVLSAVAYRGFDPHIDRRRFLAWLGVFTVAFLFMIAIRAVDPAVRPIGGEKFLDFGLLKSVLRDTTLPPEDMWFAGEGVQYYYGGHLLSAVLAILTDTQARYAYNIALAGFYATLVATAFGLVGSIAASRGASYRRGGLLGAFFVGVASNLVPALQLVLLPLPDGIARAIAGLFATLPEDSRGLGLQAAELTRPFGGQYYWTPSRVIQGTINEFPLFSWLNGDLHAHMLSTPFLLLVAGLGFAYYLTPGERLRRRRLLVFGAIPPVAGLIAVVNTWSFPSAAGVAFLAVYFAPSDPRELLPIPPDVDGEGWRGEARRLGGALEVAAAVGLLGVIWALPFFIGPATGASGRSIGGVLDRSSFAGFVLVYGWVMLVFGAYLLRRIEATVDAPRALALFGLLLGFAVLADAAAFALVGPLVLIAWVGLREDRDLGFETVLFVAGAGLVLLVELVFLREQAGPGRMNTVFKTYMQVWVLWAAATGAALAVQLPEGSVFEASKRREKVGSALAVVLVVSLSVYGVVAVGTHVQDAPEPGLDATAFVERAHPEEAAAIEWIDAREGQPTIVTAAPGGYRWNPRRGQGASAPSSLTGVPTVLGWFHEIGYRGQAAYDRRLQAVRTIYTGPPDEQARLLAEYDVAYVYVGPAERAKYGASEIGIGDLDGVTVTEEWGDVTIYRVDHAELPTDGSG